MVVRKPLDILTLAGLALAVGAIALGQALDGGHLASLVNGPAFVIVFGGTLGAIMVQSPWPVFINALGRVVWVFRPPADELLPTIDRILGWSLVARREGLLGLESLAEREPDPFTAKGLQLLVDGAEPEEIRHALEMELSAREEFEFQAARLFEAMGGYAPTIGIIGAVLGLIHVMENLAQPDRLGPGIAAAFVATVYGVGLANLVFLPMANKLKSLVRRRIRVYEVLLEGLVAISRGENPRAIDARLRGLMP